jgi:hypothetical protein
MEIDPIALQAERRILLIRQHRVMLDSDLAALYGVETGALNRAVKRNADRFPDDFMFQLTAEEHEVLKCQFGISSDWGGRRRSLAYAFTEPHPRTRPRPRRRNPEPGAQPQRHCQPGVWVNSGGN